MGGALSLALPEDHKAASESEYPQQAMHTAHSVLVGKYIYYNIYIHILSMSLLFVCLPARASPGCSRNNSQPCFSAYLRRLIFFLRRRAFFLFLILISILFRFCFFVYVFVYFPSPRAFPPAHTASQDFPVERLLASGAESTTALAIFRLCKQQSLDHRMSML